MDSVALKGKSSVLTSRVMKVWLSEDVAPIRETLSYFESSYVVIVKVSSKSVASPVFAMALLRRGFAPERVASPYNFFNV